MKRLAFAAAATLFALPTSGIAADARNPTVIELYQSQGCSSCPPALAILNSVADRPNVLALNFAVTYWDQLGWKDIFAKPAFTERQWDYARASGKGQVATPQLVVDGSTIITGADRGAVDRALATAARPAGAPMLASRDGVLGIGAGKTATPGIVWLVRYDPRTIQVAIRAGENGGRTLPHRNIVKSLTQIATWRGAAMQVKLPASNDPALRSAILVQAGKGGAILAAGRL
jgi:hypothetical protein